MNKYLVKIEYDCNDADYVYGLKETPTILEIS